jgi:hypothetical protein
MLNAQGNHSVRWFVCVAQRPQCLPTTPSRAAAALGMMLPGGAFVDIINDADDIEWECGRCHPLNTTTAAECLCGHLR